MPAGSEPAHRLKLLRGRKVRSRGRKARDSCENVATRQSRPLGGGSVPVPTSTRAVPTSARSYSASKADASSSAASSWTEARGTGSRFAVEQARPLALAALARGAREPRSLRASGRACDKRRALMADVPQRFELLPAARVQEVLWRGGSRWVARCWRGRCFQRCRSRGTRASSRRRAPRC